MNVMSGHIAKNNSNQKVPSKNRTYSQLIELELYHYKDTKLELEDYKLDLEDLQARTESIGRNTIANPTQARAIRVLTSIAIRETERRIAAIEYAIKVLSLSSEPRKLKLLEMKYFEKTYNDLAIQQELFIEQATFYRWRKEIIQLVAERLGMVV